jgi:hypothetical protein
LAWHWGRQTTGALSDLPKRRFQSTIRQLLNNRFGISLLFLIGVFGLLMVVLYLAS